MPDVTGLSVNEAVNLLEDNGIIDSQISSFERPLFCMGKEVVYRGAEDYKHYQGLGYSFEVAENPSESEFPGVTRYTYFLFGVEVVSGIRD